MLHARQRYGEALAALLDETLARLDVNSAETAHKRCCPGIPIFSWKAIVDPIPEEALQSRKAYQVWLRTFLDFDVQEARRGNIVSPWKAACDVLRDVRDNLRNAIDFGALSAESHHEFMKHVHSCNESVGRRISP